MEEGITIAQLINRAIEDKLTLEIDYAKNSFEKSTRIISDITRGSEFGVGYIIAYCHLKNEQRTFKIVRILDARIVPNKQRPAQLFNYEFDPSKPIFNLYGEKF